MWWYYKCILWEHPQSCIKQKISVLADIWEDNIYVYCSEILSIIRQMTRFWFLQFPKIQSEKILILPGSGPKLWNYSKDSELSLIFVASWSLLIQKNVYFFCLGNICFEASWDKNFIFLSSPHPFPLFRLFKKPASLQITLGLLYALNERLSTSRAGCMNNCLVCTFTSILPKCNELGLC